MTDTIDAKLERQLAALSAWDEPPQELWRAALGADGGAKAGRGGVRVVHWAKRPLSPWLLSAVATVGVVGFFVVANLPMSSVSFQSATSAASPVASLEAGVEIADAAKQTATVGRGESRRTGGVYSSAGELGGERNSTDSDGISDVAGKSAGRGGSYRRGMILGDGGGGGRARVEPTQDSPTRQVIRRVTLELNAADVRAAFAKCQIVLSAARDEFIQESSLTGSGDHVEATLTLRVAADRLADVMNELRQLGEVQSERNAGEDVTTQAVDLEARLRNESRIEDELLTLLDKRNDAPLKEILELRDKLSGVRQSIEQLTASRDRLSKLVSLATVLVIIRPAGVIEPPPKQATLGEYFVKAVSTAWRKGLTLLVDTVAMLVAILVGGAIWWVLLVAVLLVIRGALRRHAARIEKGAI